MVTIVITALDPTGQTRQFSLFADLEMVLDQLTYLMGKGENVVNACVVDGNQRLELPLEAFDGQPFSAPMQELKQQWEFILSGPVSAPSIQRRYLIELTRKRLQSYETRWASYKKTNDRLTQFCQRALDRLPEGARRVELISHYERLISSNEAEIARLKTQHHLTKKRLDQLSKAS